MGKAIMAIGMEVIVLTLNILLIATYFIAGNWTEFIMSLIIFKLVISSSIRIIGKLVKKGYF